MEKLARVRRIGVKKKLYVPVVAAFESDVVWVKCSECEHESGSDICYECPYLADYLKDKYGITLCP